MTFKKPLMRCEHKSAVSGMVISALTWNVSMVMTVDCVMYCLQAVRLSFLFHFIISSCLRNTLHQQSCSTCSRCLCLLSATRTLRVSIRTTSSRSIPSRLRVCFHWILSYLILLTFVFSFTHTHTAVYFIIMGSFFLKPDHVWPARVVFESFLIVSGTKVSRFYPSGKHR